MAYEHQNFTLTDAWSLLVAAGDDFTLTLPRRAGPVEVVPMATATAVLRLAADKHWATDVLTGLVLGAAVGVGVPLLLHGKEGGPRVQLAPMPGGLAVAGRF